MFLDETMALFPSPYIHLGGDEYFGEAWERCPDCRALVEKEDLRRYETPELKRLFSDCLGWKQKYLVYRYWMTKLCEHVRSRGRTPILWDDLRLAGPFPARGSHHGLALPGLPRFQAERAHSREPRGRGGVGRSGGCDRPLQLPLFPFPSAAEVGLPFRAGAGGSPGVPGAIYPRPPRRALGSAADAS